MLVRIKPTRSNVRQSIPMGRKRHAATEQIVTDVSDRRRHRRLDGGHPCAADLGARVVVAE
jgi:hypothetical protein